MYKCYGICKLLIFTDVHVQCHVFFLCQRIGNSLRHGVAKEIRLKRFVQVLQDPSSGLTYWALTEVRKQSVEDVERLFGPGVIAFMEKQGYQEEAKFVAMVRNWRWAIDERGLTEQQRRQFRDDFLNFIPDDWMPWHKQVHDFSLLEVNRFVKYFVCKYL